MQSLFCCRDGHIWQTKPQSGRVCRIESPLFASPPVACSVFLSSIFLLLSCAFSLFCSLWLPHLWNERFTSQFVCFLFLIALLSFFFVATMISSHRIDLVFFRSMCVWMTWDVFCCCYFSYVPFVNCGFLVEVVRYLLYTLITNQSIYPISLLCRLSFFFVFLHLWR